MYRTAIFQIAGHRNLQIAQTALCFINRDQIQKRLTRMLVGTIAGINHGHARKLGRHTGRTVFRVSLNNRIRIAGNNPRSIRKRFTLFRTGIRAIGKTDNFPTQTLYRRFKRQTRTSGRFKKARTNQLAFKQIFTRLLFQLQGRLKQQFELLRRQI